VIGLLRVDGLGVTNFGLLPEWGAVMSKTMKSLGQLNEGWGVCGFTSTFYAMYRQNPAARPWIVNATQVFSVLYEITDYLEALKAAQSPLVKAIEDFTQSFGGVHAAFTVDKYIERVNTASETARQTLSVDDENLQTDLKKQELFGIGLPPLAVADYVERMWKWKATVIQTASASQSSRSIVGVRDVTSTKMTMYNGLCHYLYHGNSGYYSWGNRYSTLEKADKDYAICYVIKIEKP